MELHDLDDEHLVVSYTIRTHFISKSANSPKKTKQRLVHPAVASTDKKKQDLKFMLKKGQGF